MEFSYTLMIFQLTYIYKGYFLDLNLTGNDFYLIRYPFQ